MTVLVTGASGHLGEALVRTLSSARRPVRGFDIVPSPFTDVVASVVDRGAVRSALEGITAVIHAATLHKPHVASHTRQAFIDTNITGTLTLLELAVEAGVGAAVFSSTTSAFGRALSPGPGAPAAWITEAVHPVPKNIYGVTKTAAEDIARLVHDRHGLPIVVLRTSRFFLEADDDATVRAAIGDENHKVNELLHRRVDIEDVVSAHLLALDKAEAIGFGSFIVSATTPFAREDAAALGIDAAPVVERRVPGAADAYRRLGWTLPTRLDRVYDNTLARERLGWAPRWTFAHALSRLEAGEPPHSALAAAVGAKGYHPEAFDDGPYPVEA